MEKSDKQLVLQKPPPPSHGFSKKFNLKNVMLLIRFVVRQKLTHLYFLFLIFLKFFSLSCQSQKYNFYPGLS